MKPHEKVFLSLVRNSLWDTQAEVPVDFKDWSLVMRLAKAQAMEGAAAKALLDSPDVLSRLKPGARDRLNNMLMTNVVMHSMAHSSIRVLVAALNNAGIDCVLLKGEGLAADYAYPDIRECGDIDLYVGVENYRRSYEVLKDVVDEIDAPSVLNGSGKHYHALLSGISVEIHKYSEVMNSASLDRIYQRYAADGLSRNLAEIESGGIKVKIPEDSFNAFYVFSHLWNHFLTIGVGLRQVSDLTVLLHARAAYLDKDYLHQVLTEMKMMTPWKTFGCIAVDILGLPEDEFPFYEPGFRNNAIKVFERILTEGDLGRETEFMRIPDRGFLYEKFFSLRWYLKRFLSLVRLFPHQSFCQLWHSVSNGLRRLFRKGKN